MSDQYPLSQDYTRLRDRENRIYEMFDGGLPLPGWSIPRITIAGSIGLLIIGGSVVVSLFTNLYVMLAGIVFSIGLSVGIYLWAGQFGGENPTLKEEAIGVIDYWLFQPKKVSGFVGDTEPDHYHVRIIMWEPTNPAWHRTYQTILNHLTAPRVESPQP